MTQLKRIRTVVAKSNHLLCIFHMPMERIRAVNNVYSGETLEQTQHNKNYSYHAKYI